ncbi:MAG: AMED_5909 family protein [Pseudonocardiaceae bacterium]
MMAGDEPSPLESTPRTLAEAHEALAPLRPRQKAPLTEWLAYYQRSAAVYAEVAEIDRGHHHEALFMAERERQSMKEIKAQISSQRPVGEM